jgi:hypothetical protein
MRGAVSEAIERTISFEPRVGTLIRFSSVGRSSRNWRRLSLIFSLLSSFGFFLTFAAPSAGQTPSPRPPINELFLTVIESLGDLRRKNHAAGIVVTDMFAPITKYYTLSEFHDYLARDYDLKKEDDWSGYYESVDIRDSKLRDLDRLPGNRKFLKYDSIRIVFKYNAERTEVINMFADLGDYTA